jgi:hypothetical protein
VPAASLRPGQRVLVTPGTRVPADGVIEEGVSGLDDSAVEVSPNKDYIAATLEPDRIHELLGPGGDSDAQALMKRVKIVSALRRPVPPDCFERMGEALLRRRRLQMRYLTRARGEVSEREVSPQRLVHYRNTWYLDAWCHSRERLLRFFSAEQVLALEARVARPGHQHVVAPLVDRRVLRGVAARARRVPRGRRRRGAPTATAW